MARLILIKHARPVIDATMPAPDWRLSDEGRRQAERLAERLDGQAPDRIAASPEPKALETARIIADRHQMPVETVDGLREHDRRRTGFLSERAFQDGVVASLRQPDVLVFGDETADAARRRFTAAVTRLLAVSPVEETHAVVTHGTVLSLYVANATGLDPVSLWRRLGLPSYVVLSRPDLALVEIVDIID